MTSPGVARSRSFVPVLAAVVLLGIADSMSGSYLVLFSADEVGLEPFQVGFFISLIALSGIVISHVAGRRFDRVPSRAILAAACVSAAAGFAILAYTTSFVVMLLLAATLLGAIAAGFPQLFALDRVLADQSVGGSRRAAVLRSGWSLAWAVGPLVAAGLLLVAGYRGLFLATAAALLLVAAVVFAAPRPQAVRVPSEQEERPARASRALILIVAAMLLFHAAMFVGSIALPLLVTRNLGSSSESVGVLFSACAVVEIVAALAVAALPARVSQRALILTGVAVMVLYFALAALAGDFVALLLAQIPRGTAIALVGIAGIRYFQDLLAPASGRATTLFSNAVTAGSLVSGVVGGVLVQAFGPAVTLAVCGVLASLALLSFWLGSRPTAVERPAL